MLYVIDHGGVPRKRPGGVASNSSGGTHGAGGWSRQASERGIDLIAADSPGSFIDDTPTAKLVRQVLGAILRGARERKRRETGKCEGRKSHAERNPDLVALVRQLRRRRPKGGQRSLRAISAELAGRGHLNERGVPFSAASINSMLIG
jgi:hypothetical protein